MDSEFLKSKEAAEYLNVSVSTLKRWRLNGTSPPSFKQGRIIRYEKKVLDKWIQVHSGA